jgi:ribosomal protein L32
LRKKTSQVARVGRRPPDRSQWVNGMSHPPKNSEVIMAHTVTTLAYSAMKKNENFIALYSV